MTTLIKYPFDPTGVKTSNLVSNELHTVTVENYKLIIPKHGMFFGSSVILTNTSTGINLELGTDYNPIEFNQNYSIRTGKSIYQAIELNETIVGVDILFTYQVLGGDYSYSNENLHDKIADISLPNVVTDFSRLTDVPRGLEPSNHPHDIREIYGFEYIVNELDRIQNGIITSLYPAYLSLLSYIDNTLQDTNNRLSEALTASLDNRIADFLGKIDRTFIGIDRLLNYSASNYQEGKNVGNNEFTIRDLPEDKFTTVEALVGLKDTMVKNLISKLSVGLGLDYSNYNLPLLTTLKNLRNYARCTIVSYNQALFYEKQRDLTIYPSTVNRDTELVYTKVAVDDSSSIITSVDRDQQNLHITTLRDGQIKLNWNKYIRTDDVSDFIYNTEIHLSDFGMLNTTVSVAHKISKDHISLDSVENLPIVSKEEVLAHVNAKKYLTFDNLLLFMNNLFTDKADDFKPKFPGKTEYLIDNCVVVFSPPGFGSDQRCDFPDGQILTRKTTKPTTTVTPIPTKPIPPLGTLIGRVCDTYTLIGIYADGWGGSYTEIITPNSPECGFVPHIPKDTELARNCEGTVLMGVYADGEGGTYNKMIEINSATCGYKPPVTNIPKGTQISYTCSGDTKLGVFADGAGGTYQALLEINSTECGYVPEPDGTIIQMNMCNFELHYKYNLIADGRGGTREEIIENNSVACGYVTPDPCRPAGTILETNLCDGTTMYDVEADGDCGTRRVNLRYLSTNCGYVPPTVLNPSISINTLVTEVTEKINNTVRLTGSVINLGTNKTYSVKWFLQNITDSDFVEQTTTYLNSDKTGTFVDLVINPTATGTVSVKARLVNTADTSEFFVSNVISLASKVAPVGPVPTISVVSSKSTVYNNMTTPLRLTAAVNLMGSTKSYGVEWFIQNLNTTTFTSIGFSNLSTDKTSSTFDTSVSPLSTGFLMFQARLVNNASTLDYVTSPPVTVTVEVKPDIGAPIVDLTISPSEVLLGDNDLITLSASISNLDTAYTYDVKWLVTLPGADSDTIIAPFGDSITGTSSSNKSQSPRSNTYFSTTGNARFGLSVTRRNSVPAITATDYVSIKINPKPTKLQILELSTSTASAITIVNNTVTTGNAVVLRIDCTDFPVSTNNIIKMYRNGTWVEDITIPTDANGRGGKSPINYEIVPADTAKFPNGPLVYEARYPLNPIIKSNVTFNITRDTRTPRIIVTNRLSTSSINVSTILSPNGQSSTTITPPKAKFDIELREFDSGKTYAVTISRNTINGPYETTLTVTTNASGGYITTTPVERDIPTNVTSGQLTYVASANNVSGSVDYTVTASSKTKSFSMSNMNPNNTIAIVDNVADPNTVKIKLEVFNLAASTSYPVNILLNSNTSADSFTMTTDASGYWSDTRTININGGMSNSNTFVFSSTIDNLPGSVTYNINRSTSNFTFTTSSTRTINVINNTPDVAELNFSLDLVALPSKSYIAKLYSNSVYFAQANLNTNSSGVANSPAKYTIVGSSIANGPLEIKADLYKLDGVTFDKSIPIQFTVTKSTKTPGITMTIKPGSATSINVTGNVASPQTTMIQVVGVDFRAASQYNIEYVKPNGSTFASANYQTDGIGGFINAIQVQFYNPAGSDYIDLTNIENSFQVRCNVVENGVRTSSSVTIYVTKTTAVVPVVKTFNVRKTDSVSTISIDANNTVNPSQVGLEFSGTGWSASSYIINVTDNYGRTYASVNVYTVNGTFTSTPMSFTIPSNTNSGGFDLRGSLDGLMATASYTITKPAATPKTFTMVKSPAINGIEMLANGTGNPSSYGIKLTVGGYTPYSNVTVTIYAARPIALNSSSSYLDSCTISIASDGTGTITRTYTPESNWEAGTLTLYASLDGGSTWPQSVSLQVTKITLPPTIVITALATSYTLNPTTGNHSTPAYLTITLNNVPGDSGYLINLYKNNGSTPLYQLYNGHGLNPDQKSANYTDTLFDTQFGGTSVVTYTADFLYRGVKYTSSPFTVYVNETTAAPTYNPTISVSSNTSSISINNNVANPSNYNITYSGNGFPPYESKQILINYTDSNGYGSQIESFGIMTTVSGTFSTTRSYNTDPYLNNGSISYSATVQGTSISGSKSISVVKTTTSSTTTTTTPAQTAAPTLTMWIDPTSVTVSSGNKATVTIHYTASNFPPYSGTGRLVIVTKNGSAMYPPGGNVQYSFYINQPNVTDTYIVEINGDDYSTGNTNITIGLDARPTVSNQPTATLSINKVTPAPVYYPSITLINNDNQVPGIPTPARHYLDPDTINLLITMTGCKPNGVYNLSWLYSNIPNNVYNQPFNVAWEQRKTFDGSNNASPALWWIKVKADYKGEVSVNVTNGKFWLPPGLKNTGSLLWVVAVEDGASTQIKSNELGVYYCINNAISSSP